MAESRLIRSNRGDGGGSSPPKLMHTSHVRLRVVSRLPEQERLRAPARTPQPSGNAELPKSRQRVTRMSTRGNRMDAKPLHCSVCKHVIGLRGGQGRRRAALIEDGLTLCDVCAPAGNHQPVRFER